MSSALTPFEGVTFHLENFFSSTQQKILSQAPGFIQRIFLEDLLKSNEEQDLKTAQYILEILAHSQMSRGPIGEKLFLALLNPRSAETTKIFRSILEIVKSPLGDLLFECAHTQKEQYYSLQTLIEMILLMHETVAYLPNPCPPLKRFFPFDQGGREILEQIAKNPINALQLLQRMATREHTSNVPKTVQEVVLGSQNQGFDAVKSLALRYLSSLSEKARLPMVTYLTLFRGIQEDLKYKTLNALEKKGLLVLVLVVTTDKGGERMEAIESIHALLNQALEIHALCGEEVLVSFCSAPALLKGVELDQALRVLHLLKMSYLQTEQFATAMELLRAFFQDKIDFQEFLNALEKEAPFLARVPVEDKVSTDLLFDRLSGKIPDPTVQFPLPLQVLHKVREQYEIVQQHCFEWQSLGMGELVKLAVLISAKRQADDLEEEDVLKLIAIGRLALRLEFSIYLYSTQVCAVLTQLYHLKGAVAQVKTGEGKTFISALLAFVLASRYKNQGHIISSSGSLCIRDQTEFAQFFKAFGITTDHICEQNPDASKFQAGILYGVATDFEFAIMREMLYGVKLFPDPEVSPENPRFRWVIVDEMDNLTIDTSLSGARLSSNAEVTYDWVYVPIFNFVKNHFTSENFELSPPLIEELKTDLKNYMGGKFAAFVDQFSAKKLNKWAHNAWVALYKREEKKHYVIGWKDSQKGEKVKGVLIVDAKNTGRILHGSRWTGGMHEFIEVKHGLDPEKENICPISMSHPVFYPMYQAVYGITGTIGSRFERGELKEIYGIESYDVPTHNPSQRIDHGITLLQTDAELIEFILKRAQQNVVQGRSLLILCESIEDTEIFGNRLTQRAVPFELLNEVQKKSEKEILEIARRPGAVTIATNTATRGTDIKPLKEVLDKGGVHVPLTYFPESDRVEMQARGRAGRQGQPGSSEIVLSRQRLNKDPKIAVLKDDEVIPFLTKRRQKKAMEEKDTHLCYAQVERHAFEMVREFYRLLNAFQNVSKKENFINLLAQFLNDRKALKKETKDYSYLSPKNKKIAENVLRLINEPIDATVQWRVLIKELVQRVQDHVLNDFALNFHAHISEIIQMSGLTSDLGTINQFKEISDNNAPSTDFIQAFQGFLKQLSDAKLTEVKTEIKGVYDKQKLIWQSYLDLSGRGILKYLSELLQIDLNPIKTDPLIPVGFCAVKSTRSLAFDRDFDAIP